MEQNLISYHNANYHNHLQLLYNQYEDKKDNPDLDDIKLFMADMMFVKKEIAEIKDQKIRIEIAKSFLTYITKAIMIDNEKELLNLPHFEPEPSPDGSINDDYEYQGEI
jgi:hypothetical protein